MGRPGPALSVDPSFVAQEKLKADERRRRFAAAAAAGAPPIPKRSVAWPGGKILTPNKADAIASFLERKKWTLDEDTERSLRAELERAAGSDSPVVDGASDALRGMTFALSAGGDADGVSQAELGRTIRAAGGFVSNTVHKKVHLLIATERAMRRGTQAVRKARDKFGIPIVTPAYVRDSIDAGSRRDHATYLAVKPDYVKKADRLPPPAAAPAATSIAARAAASGSDVMGLDDSSSGDDESDAVVGGASSCVAEAGGVSAAKTGRGGGEEESPPTRRAVAGRGAPSHGAAPLAEQRYRATLGLASRPPRASLVSRAMAAMGTRAGAKLFKTLSRRLQRLSNRHWSVLATSAERAFLVGSMRAYERAAAAWREDAAEVAAHEHHHQHHDACEDGKCGHGHDHHSQKRPRDCEDGTCGHDHAHGH